SHQMIQNRMRLGAFGGFAIPIFMGSFVDLVGKRGYSLGFSVFVLLSVIALVLFRFLDKANSFPEKEL
ncbi:hypothetical protein ACFL0H_11390, partial [Thermodesulfobacteriota bacterium]